MNKQEDAWEDGRTEDQILGYPHARRGRTLEAKGSQGGSEAALLRALHQCGPSVPYGNLRLVHTLRCAVSIKHTLTNGEQTCGCQRARVGAADGLVIWDWQMQTRE